MTDPQIRSWTFTCSGIPPSPNRHLHWAERRRRNQPLCEEILWQVKQQRPPLLAHARVTFTFVRAGGRALDLDNAYSSLKQILDCLKGLVIVDDSPAHIDLLVQQERGPRRMVSIVVEDA